MTDKEKYEALVAEIEHQKKETSIGLNEWENGEEHGRMDVINALQEKIKSMHGEPVSEDLEEAAKNHAVERYRATRDMVLAEKCKWSFKAGVQWQKENLWKPADGDDLPIIDREVIVLIKYYAQRNIHNKEYSTYRVGFGHRPNPNGWDGKNIDTNEVTHYTPKLYDKGGWNAPNIVYWLDARLPY